MHNSADSISVYIGKCTELYIAIRIARDAQESEIVSIQNSLSELGC